jgi:hypothetical protein
VLFPYPFVEVSGSGMPGYSSAQDYDSRHLFLLRSGFTFKRTGSLYITIFEYANTLTFIFVMALMIQGQPVMITGYLHGVALT